MVEQQSVNNLLASLPMLYRLKPEEAFIHNTPFTFDPSVWGLWWPLLSGSQVVIASEETCKDPLALSTRIHDYHVGVLHARSCSNAIVTR